MPTALALPAITIEAVLALGELTSRLTGALGGGIERIDRNTSPLGDRIGRLERLMTSMLEELSAMRQSIEPVASLRERLPGGG